VTRFLVRRALWFVVTVWAVVTLSFFLMRAVRGGPFSGERSLHPHVEQALQARYHLDWPLWKQYVQYVGPLDWSAEGAAFLGGSGAHTFGGLLALDFGPSFTYRDFTVDDVLAQSFPVSVVLGSLALVWALLLGLPSGILSAVKRGTPLDLGVRLVSTLGIALPNFVIAGLLVLLFVFTLGLLPPAGWGGLAHLVLPSFVLGAPFAAYVARLTRAGLLEVLSQDWVRTARAKGLPEHTVLLRHALRAGILPVVSYLGPATAGILTGSLVVEKIFAIPGTGAHFVNSALNRDYALAMGVTLIYTVLVFALNTAVDVAYSLLDPRIALEEAA
jgi:ABC-type dipeptide/oligopeptide/nickel transport system permease component